MPNFKCQIKPLPSGDPPKRGKILSQRPIRLRRKMSKVLALRHLSFCKPFISWYSGSQSFRRGFSLLEIIIAVAVLAAGVAGSVGLINRTIRTSSVVKNQFVGWYLAQEGVEVVHNIRSTNWIEQADWGDGLNGGTLSSPNTYCVDFDSQALTSPCTGAGRNLYISSGRYTHSSGTATGFSRYLEISDATDTDGAGYKLIKSIVKWNGGSAIAEDRLYDWK